MHAKSWSSAVADDLALLHDLADIAREEALRFFRTGLDVEGKATDREFDPVTLADRAIEAAIRERLAMARPDDGVLGEEAGLTQGRCERLWIVDPIDGTRAFVAGVPTWCVLIALCDAHGPKLGLIDQPFTGERFIGERDRYGELFHNGGTRRLASNQKTDQLGAALIATTDPGLFVGAEREAFQQVADQARIRRYGLDAYAYGALALGGVDLVIESGLKTWDVASHIPVVTGAGGVITNWRGGPCHEGGQVLAAANPALHALALKLLEPAAAS